jgi:hypothetical protein
MMQSGQMEYLYQSSTSVTVDKLSHKQILGECISLATNLLKELIVHYFQQNNINKEFDKVGYCFNIENRFYWVE